MNKHRCEFIGNDFLVEIVPEIYWRFNLTEVDKSGHKRNVKVYPDDNEEFPKIPYQCEYNKDCIKLRYRISKKNLFRLIKLSEKI